MHSQANSIFGLFLGVTLLISVPSAQAQYTLNITKPAAGDTVNTVFAVEGVATWGAADTPLAGIELRVYDPAGKEIVMQDRITKNIDLANRKITMPVGDAGRITREVFMGAITFVARPYTLDGTGNKVYQDAAKVTLSLTESPSL